MQLPLKWVFEKPIDLEHKEYVLLDYISKIDKELENFKLYPTFQELSIHLANLTAVKEKLEYIQMREYPEEIDDEILIYNIIYKKIKGFENEDLKNIVKIAKNSHEKLKDYFLIAKSIWSIVFESVLIRPFQNNIDKNLFKNNEGYLIFRYKEETFLYKFEIKKINRKFDEDKCEFTFIKSSDYIIVKDEIDLDKEIVFVAEFNEEFPLDGCLLSITKRKVMNYIKQTINIIDIKKTKLNEI
jgi:hypothetical protein